MILEDSSCLVLPVSNLKDQWRTAFSLRLYDFLNDCAAPELSNLTFHGEVCQPNKLNCHFSIWIDLESFFDCFNAILP